MLNITADSDETLTMPDVSDVFASPARSAPAIPVVMKLAGAGDSVRNEHSAVKAPGGSDATRSRDGG